MPNAYTVLWSKDRCDHLRKHEQVGQPLTMLFGGPHISEPRFSRFGVRAGDTVYPIRILKGIVYVLGRMEVAQILALDAFTALYLQRFTADGPYESAYTALSRWLAEYPEKQFLAPTCTDEVVLGDGTPLRLDVAIPPDLLARLRFCSRRGERGLNNIVDGKLKSSLSLQGGVYRLSPASADEIGALLAHKESASEVTNESLASRS